MLTGPSTSPPPIVTASAAPAPGLKSRYLALQQEADFALWRAREANAEARKAWQAQLAGTGPAPTPEQLAEIHALEVDAEARYRELRSFLREYFS